MKLIICMIMMSPLLASAGGVSSLKSFFSNTVSMRADFHQMVMDSQGRKVQEVDGLMQLQRPGKFRWDYKKPYIQQIIGDGEKVWLYDPDLNQVTVRTIGKALGSSPAALLAGSKEIERAFTLSDEDKGDDLEWVLAIPNDKESGFEKVMLGFKNDVLVKMELYDSFAHLTNIEFNKFERNPKLTPQTFRFAVPTGADVVGE